MTDFPESPVPPAELLERYLPAAFAKVTLPDGARDAELELGVALSGAEGGEWVVRVMGGEVAVVKGARDETAFTYVQSVDDWRGALWEGRGGAVGRQTGIFFRPGGQPAYASAGFGAPPRADALDQMRALDGLIQVVVSGGEGGDWAVGFKLGPGPLPDEPSTTVTLTDRDATDMASGELNPMEAFLAGRIQVAGDMTLMMQMLAVQMQPPSQG